MAKLLGMKLRMYSAYETGEYDESEGDVRRERILQKLKSLPDVPDATLTKTDSHKATSSKPVPYFELDVSAGNIEMFSDTPEVPTQSISIPGFDDCDMALPIFGNSMYPTFESGVIIMCKKLKDKSIIQYGESYLIITSEQRMVKRIQKGDRRDLVLAVSDNESVNGEGIRKYESFEIPRDKILHLYIVKGSIRRNQI